MNSKKIVSMIGAAVVAASMALTSLPVCAAVTTMPDGGQFDAAYYAATYPDVVAALGTDANALYQHYKTFGAKEGRLPYAAGTAAAATTTAPTTVTLTAKEKANAKKILNEYISGKRGWGVTAYTPYKWAENPRFAIADLNKDGLPELYTYGGEGWDVFSLESTPGEYPDRQVTGYNAALNMYAEEFGLGGSISTSDIKNSTIVRDFAIGGMLDEDAVEDLTNNTIISWAEYEALMAQFPSIDTVLQTTPITKANVNAIK